jgi:hypothetical protein
MYKMLGKIVQIVQILLVLPVVLIQRCWSWVVCAEQYLVRLVLVRVHIERYIHAYMDLYNLYNLYIGLHCDQQTVRHVRMRVKGSKFFQSHPP